MKHPHRTAGLTLALTLTGYSAFANNNVSYISDEAAAVILGVLILVLISTIAAFVLAAGNISRKSRSRRTWSFILGLPLTIIGLVTITFIPVIGLIFLALTVPLWIMIFKSMHDNVAE